MMRDDRDAARGDTFRRQAIERFELGQTLRYQLEHPSRRPLQGPEERKENLSEQARRLVDRLVRQD